MRTASQIRPPSSNVRNASTASLPTSTTRTIPKRPQPSLVSTARNLDQIRQRHEAAAISNQMSGATTQSVSMEQGQRVSKHISVRPARAKQTAIASTQSARPRSATSLVSESSITSASNRTGDVSIPQSQRDELVQLSITHLNSQRVLDTYERHIQQNIVKRTTTVADEDADLLRLERQEQCAISSGALRSWLDHNLDSTNVQQIQDLSTAIQRLNSHDLDMKHAETLRMFQQWLERVVNVQKARLGRIPPNKLQFVASLGHLWHRQASEIEQSLSIIVTTLEDGKPKPENSGIAVVVAQNLRLAKVMHQEIQTATTMEKTVVLAESDWEQEQINKAIDQLSLMPMDAGIGLWAA